MGWVRKTASPLLLVGATRDEAVGETGVVRGIGTAAREVCSNNVMAKRDNALIFSIASWEIWSFKKGS